MQGTMRSVAVSPVETCPRTNGAYGPEIREPKLLRVGKDDIREGMR